MTFEFSDRTGESFGIRIVNLLLPILTFGTLVYVAPLSAVTRLRLAAPARCHAAHSRLIPGGAQGHFIGTLPAWTSASGDDRADVEGIDIGLPV